MASLFKGMIEFCCHSDFLEDYSADSGWLVAQHTQPGDVIVPSAQVLTSSPALTLCKMRNIHAANIMREFCFENVRDIFQQIWIWLFMISHDGALECVSVMTSKNTEIHIKKRTL